MVNDDSCIPRRDTSPHQDSTGTAPSGTPPPAQPPAPPQTRETQFHSAPAPLKRPMLTPEGGPRPRSALRQPTNLSSTRRSFNGHDDDDDDPMEEASNTGGGGEDANTGGGAAEWRIGVTDSVGRNEAGDMEVCALFI